MSPFLSSNRPRAAASRAAGGRCTVRRCRPVTRSPTPCQRLTQPTTADSQARAGIPRRSTKSSLVLGVGLSIYRA